MLLINPRDKQVSVSNEDKQHEMPSSICILVGSLTSLGFFCRQTFLVFALVPYFGFLIDQVKRQQSYVVKTVAKLILMALGFLITSMVFILLDSWYFGYLQEGNLVVTPMNFIKYNAFHSHAHGYHPFFTHFLVNIPLLFGPMAFLLYLELGTLIWKFGGENQNEQTRSHVSYKKFHDVLLVLSISVPIFILSLVPHQEPRFLMPVFIPMVLLFSSKIAGPKNSPSLLLSWSIWNVIGCIFFGILHQAGIVPSLYHLHKSINEKVHVSAESYCHHVVYFHTYMPPTHLLAWPNDALINTHKLYVHDLAGSSRETFNLTMSKLKSDYCNEDKNMVYIVYPATVEVPVQFNNDANMIKFFPHLSMEDPPNFHQHITDLFFNTNYQYHDSGITTMNIIDISRTVWNHVCSQLQKMKCDLSLNLHTTRF
ncbi:GPI mannosyltransferase 4-like isoform X2 [Dendronephthya gigantea]|nr:GPI mannosyltransferase 4-like isoform X2 [Dendronephthya gigantea]